MMARTVFVPYPVKSGPQRVNVTHNHAPTEKSVELLRDMELAARNEVLQSISMSGNGFEGVLHFCMDPASAEVILRVVFDLNGRRFEIEDRARDDVPRDEAIQSLKGKVAERVAIEILSWALEKIAHKVEWKQMWGRNISHGEAA